MHRYASANKYSLILQPGNVAVDAVDGGRLIYYDFGMMGRIQTDVRKGLLELFYGIYQKDSDKCLDALVTMGVLVPGGDRIALRRTCDFFLKSFEDRLQVRCNSTRYIARFYAVETYLHHI